VLLRRHPVGVHLKDGVLIVGEAWVLLLVPALSPPIVRAVGEETGVEADPLDSPARLWGHRGGEVDIGAHFYIVLLIITRKYAPILSAPSSSGSGSVCVGDDTADTCSYLEAPRPVRARSEAQIAAFEKARAKRAANLSASAPPAGVALPEPAAAPLAPATPPETAPEPAASPPAPTTPPPKRRGSRSDKGKKRGYLVRTKGGVAPD
jgi:hypothetical protein